MNVYWPISAGTESAILAGFWLSPECWEAVLRLYPSSAKTAGLDGQSWNYAMNRPRRAWRWHKTILTYHAEYPLSDWGTQNLYCGDCLTRRLMKAHVRQTVCDSRTPVYRPAKWPMLKNAGGEIFSRRHTHFVRCQWLEWVSLRDGVKKWLAGTPKFGVDIWHFGHYQYHGYPRLTATNQSGCLNEAAS